MKLLPGAPQCQLENEAQAHRSPELMDIPGIDWSFSQTQKKFLPEKRGRGALRLGSAFLKKILIIN